MIQLLRDFVGSPPAFLSPYNFGDVLEYVFGVSLLFVVIFSLYSLFGQIINIFRK